MRRPHWRCPQGSQCNPAQRPWQLRDWGRRWAWAAARRLKTLRRCWTLWETPPPPHSRFVARSLSAAQTRSPQSSQRAAQCCSPRRKGCQSPHPCRSPGLLLSLCARGLPSPWRSRYPKRSLPRCPMERPLGSRLRSPRAWLGGRGLPTTRFAPRLQWALQNPFRLRFPPRRRCR